ncbi:MAG: hypothetical protein DDT33_01366 [Firmicutes bacterium]|nr:hypothetical protein [Bacillota bacterium]
MRVAEAAKRLEVSERSLYRLIRDGTLPNTKETRNQPVLGYELSDTLILTLQEIMRREQCSLTPARIKSIVKEEETKIKKKEKETNES